MTKGLDPTVWAGLRMLPVAARIELIDLYVETLPRLLVELRTATDVGNSAAFRALVHQLKGSSASLGVQGLWHLCEELEEQSRVGALTDLAAAVQRIEAAYGHGLRALATQRASLRRRTR